MGGGFKEYSTSNCGSYKNPKCGNFLLFSLFYNTLLDGTTLSSSIKWDSMVGFRLSNIPVIPYDCRGSWFYFFSNESMKIIPYGAPNIDIKNFSSGCYIF